MGERGREGGEKERRREGNTKDAPVWARFWCSRGGRRSWMEGEGPEPKTHPFGRVFGIREVEGGDTRHIEHAHMGVFYTTSRKRAVTLVFERCGW